MEGRRLIRDMSVWRDSRAWTQVGWQRCLDEGSFEKEYWNGDGDEWDVKRDLLVGPASQKAEHIRRGTGQVHLDIKVVLGTRVFGDLRAPMCLQMMPKYVIHLSVM